MSSENAPFSSWLLLVLRNTTEQQLTMATTVCNQLGIVCRKCGILATHMGGQIDRKLDEVRGENHEACHVMESICQGFGAFLTVLLVGVKDMVTSAFFPFLFITFALNTPPFAFGLATIFSDDCSSSWLVFNAFLAAIHMMTSMYVVYRIRVPDKSQEEIMQDANALDTPYVDASEEPVRADNIDGTEENSWDRIRMVLCYDMVMAIYYVMCIIWAAWQIVGVKAVAGPDLSYDACAPWQTRSIAFGFLYMFLGLAGWIASLCFLRYYKLSEKFKPSDKDILAICDNGDVEIA